MNAIMNKNSSSVEGCTIYVALFPCNECAKMIIQVGQFIDDWKDHDVDSVIHLTGSEFATENSSFQVSIIIFV